MKHDIHYLCPSCGTVTQGGKVGSEMSAISSVNDKAGGSHEMTVSVQSEQSEDVTRDETEQCCPHQHEPNSLCEKVKLTHLFALENRLTQSVIVNHSLLMLS